MSDIPSIQATSRQRIPSLDGLRGFSIICVLWSHAVSTPGFPIRWSPDGAIGVRTFFVISGFIITWLLLKEEQTNQTISLKGFYRRRAARILPACWAYLLVVAVLGRIGVFPLHFAGDIVRPLTFTMGLAIWPKTIAWQTAHTWSLAVEEQFYLIWPPLFVMLPKRLRVLIAALVVAAGPVFRCEIYFHPRQWGLIWTIVGNGDMLAWGCLLALVRADYPTLLAKIVGWRPAIARVLAIAVIQFAPWYFWKSFIRKYPPLSTNALSFSVQAMAIAFLIASLIEVRRGIIYRAMNLPLMVGLGTLSYSLYLWQQLFFAESEHAYRWNQWPINLACIMMAATASYFLIERPLRIALRGRSPRNAYASIARFASPVTVSHAAPGNRVVSVSV